jgi:hypothetical protein
MLLVGLSIRAGGISHPEGVVGYPQTEREIDPATSQHRTRSKYDPEK